MIKTLAELKAYFQTGDKPTQSEFENLIDSTYRGYKVYTALLTQSGTDAPVATVLDNTIGEGIVWSRLAASQYRATLTGAFTVGKTVILLDALNLFALSSLYISKTTSINNVTIQASDSVDDYLSEMLIEIRVYN